MFPSCVVDFFQIKKKTATTWCFLTKAFRIVDSSRIRWSTVEWCFQKPHCSFASRPSVSTLAHCLPSFLGAYIHSLSEQLAYSLKGLEAIFVDIKAEVKVGRKRTFTTLVKQLLTKLLKHVFIPLPTL